MMSSTYEEDLNQIWTWNSTFPGVISCSVQDLIIQRARTQPDQPAICAWDGNFSYGQLISLASALARCLEQGICSRNGKVLPIWMNKSKWMPVAMLGALMSGWGITPLDINTPSAKLNQILNMLNPPCVLMLSGSKLPPSPILPIAVDQLGLENQHAGEKVFTLCPPAEVAVVVFTSGSTGSPKGVKLGPHCVATTAIHGSQILQLDQSSRVFQFSSYSFDISLHETFMTLVSGGCLSIPSETERMDNPLAAINMTESNFICTTPSVMMTMLADELPSTPINTIVLTGEALNSRISPLFSTGLRLFSWYGATECPIVSLTLLTQETWKPSQISSRTPGSCWVIRTEDLNTLCGFGEIGELLVESPMLTLGYLNARQQSQAAFLEDPTWLVRGHGHIGGRSGKLYRTGDLVRNNQDGTFDYIGRKDTMVKIRGQRVDLGAIETQLWKILRSSSLIQTTDEVEVVVEAIAFRDDNDGVRLTCFLSYRPHSKDEGRSIVQRPLAQGENRKTTTLLAPNESLRKVTAELDAKLRDVLPDYMVPALYLQVKNMPLTNSGKIDRRLLSSLCETIDGQDLVACWPTFPDDKILPRDSTEKRLQQVWGEVLRVDPNVIGTTASFTQCGGNSLRAVSLVKALSKEFQLSITLPQLLRQDATIQHLSKLMQQPGSDLVQQRPQLKMEEVLKSWIRKLENCTAAQPLVAQRANAEKSLVLLTGATGYLGIHILGELVTSGHVKKAIVLVRASSPGQALDRIRETASVAGWWNDSMSSLIEIWVGDLTQPRFGLCEETWNRLSEIHTIIHNGAVVNYGLDFETMEESNIRSTFQLLETTFRSQCLQQFIYVSGGAKQDPDKSDAEHLQILDESEGYSQTKFISEKLTRVAGEIHYERAQGYSSPGFYNTKEARQDRIFRVIKPGYLIGDQVSGLSNTDDFIWKLVAGAVRMGSYPCDPPGYWLDIAEVTHAAKRIARQLQCKLRKAQTGLISPASSDENGDSSPEETAGGDHHTSGYFSRLEYLDRGIPVHRFWLAIQEQLGISLEPIHWPSWISQAQRDMEHLGDSHPLWGIQQFLGPALGYPCSGPRNKIEEGSLRAPKNLDRVERAIRRSVQYLMDIQFLTLPATATQSRPNESPESEDIIKDPPEDHEPLAKRRAIGEGNRPVARRRITRSAITY